MTPRVEAEGLQKAFGRNQVLRDVSFRAGEGEIVGIVGENGAGKSTLLRILVGFLAADGGQVRIGGRLGYCDQNPQLFPDLTVDEHFEYFARGYDLDRVTWMAARDELFSRFGFAAHAEKRVSELSGGTVQKLHLSLAVLHRPDVLLLDEPYVAFDWDTYVRFWEYAADLRQAGTTVVIVSHIAHERHRLDRVLELRNGVASCA